MRWLAAALAGGVLYLLALSSARPLDLALGAAVALLLALSLPLAAFADRPRPGLVLLARFAWAPVLSFGIIVAVGRGVAQVVVAVVGSRPADRDGLVDLPIGERSEAGVVVSALVASLSPGSMLIEIDRDRGVLVFHLLDASDADGFRREQERFYRRYQRRVIP